MKGSVTVVMVREREIGEVCVVVIHATLSDFHYFQGDGGIRKIIIIMIL